MDELVAELLPEDVPDVLLFDVVDLVVELVASLAKTMSPAAWVPLADGSLTLITQCAVPACFCAAVGGQ